MGCCCSRNTVINRDTGDPVQEIVPFSDTLKLNFLFNSMIGRCAVRTSCLRSYLKNVSHHLGEEYEKPESKHRIQKLISDYGIDVSEIELSIEQYQSLNQFFYRRLKPNARPTYEAKNPGIATQPADCRLGVFNTVEQAKTLWIKGDEFTISSLLGDSKLAEKFENCSLALCRLAPTDYHRFHSPVDCVVGHRTDIDGEYYSVKAVAVKSPVNTLALNKRSILLLDSAQFGTVAYVIVGATHVGSIITTVKEGQAIHKGDEIGYFAYGGSTIVVLFQRGKIVFDQDLQKNSQMSRETLVKMGTSLGRLANSAEEKHN